MVYVVILDIIAQSSEYIWPYHALYHTPGGCRKAGIEIYLRKLASFCHF